MGILHIVLFRPKPEVSDVDRAAMFDALRSAATEIPSVRRFTIGRRVVLGRTYDALMTSHYPFAAIVECENVEGLKSYLDHPKHENLGRLFYQLSESALVYDYEVTSASGEVFTIN